MAAVMLLGVNILNNPAKFTDKYELEITFECYEDLQKDLEWKLTYVGSATSNEYDQELDSLLVGPVPRGVNKFVFEADPPDTNKIPDAELLGVTVVLLSCSYDKREFVRVGYYVSNEYDSEELKSDPPAKPVLDRIQRNLLAEKPRVTRFAIKWDSEESAPAEFPPEQPGVDAEPADGDEYGKEEAQLEEAEESEAAATHHGEGALKGDDTNSMEVDNSVPAVEEEEEDDDDEDDEEGSEIDLEGESDADSIDGPGEGEADEGFEGEAGDAMEVDEDDAHGPEKPADASMATHADTVMSH